MQPAWEADPEIVDKNDRTDVRHGLEADIRQSKVMEF